MKVPRHSLSISALLAAFVVSITTTAAPAPARASTTRPGPTSQAAEVSGDLSRPVQPPLPGPGDIAPRRLVLPPICGAPAEYHTLNWSGIVDACHRYYEAEGQFNANCPLGQANTIVSYFAGLGGVYTGDQLIQSVVADRVFADGTHHFQALAENNGAHDAQIDITPPGGIHCGDRIAFGVTQFDLPYNDGNQLYDIIDETTKQHGSAYVYRSAAWPPTHGDTAEIIVERPTLTNAPDPSCPYAPLTQWGGWPFMDDLEASYMAADGPHPNLPMTALPYERTLMYSCDLRRILEEPFMLPTYNNMWMQWLAPM